MTIRSEVEKITPALAEEILDHSKEHVRNRKIHDTHVAWLSDQMKSGKWKTNGEPIIMDEEGHLMDGQHRLYAVALSGCTIETVVTRGVDRATFASIDTGVGRTTADVLSINDEPNAPILSVALGWFHRYEQGKMLFSLKTSGFTSAVAISQLKRNGPIHEAVTWACGMKRTVILQKVSASSLAFLKYMFSMHKPILADEFFELVADIRGDHPGTPTRVLRDCIIKDERSRNPASSLEMMALIVKAWTAFLNGTKPLAYVWRRTGATPESFPKFPGDVESRGKAIRGTEEKRAAARKRKNGGARK